MTFDLSPHPGLAHPGHQNPRLDAVRYLPPQLRSSSNKLAPLRCQRSGAANRVAGGVAEGPGTSAVSREGLPEVWELQPPRGRSGRRPGNLSRLAGGVARRLGASAASREGLPEEWERQPRRGVSRIARGIPQ